MATKKVPRSFGTHDGTFHADEVSACALLLHFNLIDVDKIIRTRDLNLLDNCEFVCDVGGVYNPSQKHFDHHQVNYQGALSSAGMILLHLRETGHLSDHEYEFLNHSIILGVDAHDNGRDPQMRGLCTYSNIITNYTPIPYDVPPSVQDAAFMEAVSFATLHFARLLHRYHYMESCRQHVIEAMNNGHECLMFNKSIPWLEIFFENGGAQHPAKFLIMPSGTHWKLRGIPPSLDEKMKVRSPLPQEWAGLIDEELRKASGIPGAIFCHKGRFISVWETRDDALEALNYTLNKAEKR